MTATGIRKLRQAVGLAVGLGLAPACVTEPPPPALTGQFGGRLLNVVATDTAVHFEFACWLARTGPLRVDARGIGEARGWARTSAAGGGPADYRVIVVQHADTLRVFSTFVAGQTVWTDTATVWRSQPADFSGVACLDAT